MAKAKSTSKKRSSSRTTAEGLRQSGRSSGQSERSSARTKAKTRKDAATQAGEASSNGTPVTVSDVMSPDPLTMLEIATLSEAAERMVESGADTVITLHDTTAHATGIITFGDIVLRAVAKGLNPATTTLSAVQSEGLVIMDPDASVDEAVALMRQHGIRRIPVVDGRNVLGMVTLESIASAVEPRATLSAIATQA